MSSRTPGGTRTPGWNHWSRQLIDRMSDRHEAWAF
jgi:hypothetical protein